MGFALYDLHIPCTKTTSSLLFLERDAVSEAKQIQTACINCGRCVSVCPGHVVPARLATLAEHGDARFRNLNGDNTLDSNDRDYIGNPNPDVIYGGNIELGYKGIDFALYFQGVAGNDIWVGTKALLRQTSITNLLAETYTDAWRNPGDKTDVFGITRISLFKRS